MPQVIVRGETGVCSLQDERSFWKKLRKNIGEAFISLSLVLFFFGVDFIKVVSALKAARKQREGDHRE